MPDVVSEDPKRRSSSSPAKNLDARSARPSPSSCSEQRIAPHCTHASAPESQRCASAVIPTQPTVASQSWKLNVGIQAHASHSRALRASRIS